jgi:hypothetical protein
MFARQQNQRPNLATCPHPTELKSASSVSERRPKDSRRSLHTTLLICCLSSQLTVGPVFMESNGDRLNMVNSWSCPSNGKPPLLSELSLLWLNLTVLKASEWSWGLVNIHTLECLAWALRLLPCNTNALRNDKYNASFWLRPFSLSLKAFPSLLPSQGGSGKIYQIWHKYVWIFWCSSRVSFRPSPTMSVPLSLSVFLAPIFPHPPSLPPLTLTLWALWKSGVSFSFPFLLGGNFLSFPHCNWF